jgi:hypothetical protein
MAIKAVDAVVKAASMTPQLWKRKWSSVLWKFILLDFFVSGTENKFVVF